MKTLVRVAAIATVALAPFAAHSQDSAVYACADAFIAQSFAGKSTVVRVEREYAPLLPLVLQSNSSRVKLVASEKATNRVLATATCSTKGGIVTVEPVKADLIASL
jgi:hypothetical protein